MDKTTRLPRPQGATLLSTKFRETGNNDDREALYRHLITIYTTSGFRWNGVPTSIPDLSAILNIPQSEIMGLVSQTGQNMGNLADPQNIKNTLQTIITLSTSFALQDRGLIMQQLETLLSSQGGQYRPFITGEVNKVLKLVLDSNKNIADIYKTFTGTSTTTNILNIFGDKSKSEDGKEYLTADDAVKMLNSPDIPKALPAKNNKGIEEASLVSDSDYYSDELGDYQDIPADSPEKSLADTAQLAKELSEKYGIVGQFEDFGGPTGALKPSQAGTEGLEAQELKGSKPRPRKRDDGGFGRRAIELSDQDELPMG